MYVKIVDQKTNSGEEVINAFTASMPLVSDLRTNSPCILDCDIVGSTRDSLQFMSAREPKGLFCWNFINKSAASGTSIINRIKLLKCSKNLWTTVTIFYFTRFNCSCIKSTQLLRHRWHLINIKFYFTKSF